MVGSVIGTALRGRNTNEVDTMRDKLLLVHNTSYFLLFSKLAKFYIDSCFRLKHGISLANDSHLSDCGLFTGTMEIKLNQHSLIIASFVPETESSAKERLM